MAYEGGYTSAVNSESNRGLQDAQRQAQMQQLVQAAVVFQQQQDQQKKQQRAREMFGNLLPQLTRPPAPGAQPPEPGASSMPMAPPPPPGQIPPPPGAAPPMPPPAAAAPPGGGAAPMPQGAGGAPKPVIGPPGDAASSGPPPQGWRPLPAPPGASPQASDAIAPPPEDALMPRQAMSVAEVAKLLDAKGIKGADALDMIEQWKPFMDTQNKAELDAFKVKYQAQEAAKKAYQQVMRDAETKRHHGVLEGQGAARVGQAQQRIDKKPPGGAPDAGNQGTSKKYDSDPEYAKKVDFWANVLKDGGQLPPRFAQSGAGKAMFSDIVSVVPTLGTGDHREMRAGTVELAGDKSKARALGTRSANIEQAAAEAREMSSVVVDTSSKFKRTEFQPVNKALAAFEKQTGGTEVRQFGAAINSYINAYARAVNPSGVATVSDKEHAREMLSTADTADQVKAIIAVLDREMTAAQNSPRRVREDQRKEITGNRSQSQLGAPKKGDVVNGYTYLGGPTENEKSWQKAP